MNLFINDTPFFLLRNLDEADPLLQKSIHRGDEIFDLKGLAGTVVITDVSTKQALRYLLSFDLRIHYVTEMHWKVNWKRFGNRYAAHRNATQCGEGN